ncbi:MAG: glutaredoxin family protein [Actinomycetota bacterium]
MAARVRVYTREGCGLCREALAVIARVRSRVPFDLEEVDIGGDDDLERAYGIRIPVVLVDGVEAFDFEVDARAFEALVRP